MHFCVCHLRRQIGYSLVLCELYILENGGSNNTSLIEEKTNNNKKQYRQSIGHQKIYCPVFFDRLDVCLSSGRTTGFSTDEKWWQKSSRVPLASEINEFFSSSLLVMSICLFLLVNIC